MDEGMPMDGVRERQVAEVVSTPPLTWLRRFPFRLPPGDGGVKRVLMGAGSLAAFLLAWYAAATSLSSPYVPQPLAVARALARALVVKDFLGFTLGQHVVSSLSRIGVGFGLAMALAIPLGLASGWLRWIEGFSNPVVEVLRPIPPLAWIPFAIYFFGDPLDAVFVVFLAAFFPLYLSTLSGVKSVDPILVDAARTLGARRLSLFAKVVVPAALNPMVTGMRIGIGIAWMSIVAAEMVGVRGGGLGVYLWAMAEVGRFDSVFAGMGVIGLIGLVLTGGIERARRRYLSR